MVIDDRGVWPGPGPQKKLRVATEVTCYLSDPSLAQDSIYRVAIAFDPRGSSSRPACKPRLARLKSLRRDRDLGWQSNISASLQPNSAIGAGSVGNWPVWR